jgi:leader peptidase (prepilin peptidase)/N-methyltransferase
VLVIAILAGFAGLLIGSFLNVVIARVPAGQSVVRPRSRCPHCDQPIAARDNIPLISWALLRGRGRCCGQPISVRYPLVELATGLGFAAVTWWLIDRQPWTIPAFLFLMAVSIALAMIDIATFKLPFIIVAPAYPVAVILLALASWPGGQWSALTRALIGGAVLWSLYRLLHLIYPSGMGYGDVRLAGLLGLYLGWTGWGALFVGGFAGFLIGGVGGVVVLTVLKGSLKAHIPFGPYMFVGAWLGLIGGSAIAEWYLRVSGF